MSISISQIVKVYLCGTDFRTGWWRKGFGWIVSLCVIALTPAGRADTLISSTPYTYTGGSVNYTVPAGTNYLVVKCWGAGGGCWVGYLYGGAGGFAQGQVSATPGSVYVIKVGGGGLRNTFGGTGGWSNGSSGSSGGCGGGGASFFYGGSTNIVAGGGGGASNAPGGVGGGGYYGTPGGLSLGSSTGGGGGLNSSGGTGGQNYFTGTTNTVSMGQTGFAANAVNTSDPDYPGNSIGAGGGIAIYDGNSGYVVVKAYATTAAPTFSGSLTTQNCNQSQWVSFAIPATGIPAPTFSASGLPPGLSCNSSTGVISGYAGIGTPGSPTYTYNSTVTATNSVGYISGTLSYVVTAAHIVPTGSISGPNPLITLSTIYLVQGGTTNFPFGWTQGTMWNPDGSYTVLPNTASYQTQSYTVNHGPGTYSWQFRIVDTYGNYMDQWVTCSVSNPSVTPPTISATPFVGSTFVTFSWSGAQAQAGIGSYSIYRNGVYLTSVSSSTTTYTDTPLSPLTNYTYSVYTVDSRGTASGSSSPIGVTTAPDFEMFTPIP